MVRYAPVFFVKDMLYSVFMSMEGGLSVMGDCQFSYTGTSGLITKKKPSKISNITFAHFAFSWTGSQCPGLFTDIQKTEQNRTEQKRRIEKKEKKRKEKKRKEKKRKEKKRKEKRKTDKQKTKQTKKTNKNKNKNKLTATKQTKWVLMSRSLHSYSLPLHKSCKCWSIVSKNCELIIITKTYRKTGMKENNNWIMYSV